MNCQSFENIIDEIAREQLIEASKRSEALQHSDECPTCLGRLKAEQGLTASLRALALEMNSAEAPERVESFLLASFNELTLAHNTQRSRRWSYLSMAAAAVILAAVGIGFALWSLPAPLIERANKVEQTTVPASQSPIPTSETLGGSRGKPEIVQKPVVRRRSAASRTPLQRVNADTGTVGESAVTEVTTDFMPIGYVNSASLQDGGSVVRVELPRSTIVSMGFALNMDRSGDRVKADVLMGADGLARAIRFVQ
jgi:hypothetical protein